MPSDTTPQEDIGQPFGNLDLPMYLGTNRPAYVSSGTGQKIRNQQSTAMVKLERIYIPSGFPATGVTTVLHFCSYSTCVVRLPSSCQIYLHPQRNLCTCRCCVGLQEAQQRKIAKSHEESCHGNMAETQPTAQPGPPAMAEYHCARSRRPRNSLACMISCAVPNQFCKNTTNNVLQSWRSQCPHAICILSWFKSGQRASPHVLAGN